VREASKESQNAWLVLDKRAQQGINDTLSSLALDEASGVVRHRRRLAQANGYCRDNPNYRLHLIYKAQDGRCPASRAAQGAQVWSGFRGVERSERGATSGVV
jgi:hypothetical protein